MQESLRSRLAEGLIHPCLNLRSSYPYVAPEWDHAARLTARVAETDTGAVSAHSQATALILLEPAPGLSQNDRVSETPFSKTETLVHLLDPSNQPALGRLG